MNVEPRSLGEALRLQAEAQRDGPAVTFIDDGERDETTWTFGDLDQRARAIAVALSDAGVTSGDRALILHPPGLSLVAAFFGCQYAGVIPALSYPPAGRSTSRSQQRLQALIEDAQGRILLRDRAEEGAAPLPVLATFGLDLGASSSYRERVDDPDDAAFLQYTSGSTREPRGVVISQRNVLANLRHIAAVSMATAKNVRVVMWVPPYHDLGLVGGILMPIASGFPTHLMDPRRFMQRPMRWLEAISRRRATATGAPDSSYDLCARNARDEDLNGLDLSTWTIAFNGSEKVRPETLRRFSERFASCGFRPETLYPCYGLAEATLIVSGGKPGAHWREHSFPVDEANVNGALDRDRPAESQVVVSMGKAIPGHEILIVSPETGGLCVDGEIGEIWVNGPSVARRYWNRVEENEATFGGRLPGAPEVAYLRTGDLGRLVDGELFVAGRMKDLILIRGRNLFPQDIEATVEASHGSLEANACSAFAVELDSHESLIVLAEVRRAERHHIDKTTVLDAIRRAVSGEHEVPARAVLLLGPGQLPRTTSGKIRRAEARRMYLAGDFTPLGKFDGSSQAPYPLPAALPGPVSLEMRLRRRAASLLRTDPRLVPVDRPLRDLGLDSLMRVELLLALSPETRAALPAFGLDRDLTLKALAELAEVSVTLAGPALSSPGQQIIPLTARQRAFFAQPGLTQPERFAIQVRLGTPPGLNQVAFASALRDLGEKHEALRLRFRMQESGWHQILDSSSPPLSLEAIDISQYAPGQLQAQALDLDARLILAIDLGKGPLLSALILDAGPRQSGIVSIVFHHLVTDALSVAILLADLAHGYEWRLRRPSMPDDRRESPPPGFAAWCRAQDTLGGTSVLPADQVSAPIWVDPTLGDNAAAEARTGPVSERNHELSPEQDALLLQRFPESRDMEALLLAALAWAFGNRTGQALVVSVQAHGRWPRHGMDPRFWVGWFASLSAIRLERATDAHGTTLLQSAQSALKAVREESPESRSAGPAPRVRFEYRSIIEDRSRLGTPFSIIDVLWRCPPRARNDSEEDLSLAAGHRRGRLWWGLSFDPRVYSRLTVAGMTADIAAYLERWLIRM